MNTLDGVHLVTDDAEVKACLAYHGRAPAMLQADTLAADQDMPRSFCYWTTGRAFYVVAHFQGYAEPTDNGYSMLVIALDLYTLEQAAEIAQAFVNAGRDFTGPTFGHYVEMPSEAVN